MTTRIEKSIPIPASRKGRAPKYPWDSMDVGDSFLVSDVSNTAVIRAVAYTHSVRPGRRFTTRKTPNGTRVWRVS